AEKYHHVIRKLLDPWLVIEEQIAGLSFASIATDEDDVEILQGAGVGEFRKPSIANVGFVERSEIRAKDLFAEWVLVQVETLHVRRHGLVRRSHLLKPETIVMSQGLANREARQSGTVALFSVPLIGRLIELGFGDRCEPAAKAVAILKRAQLDNIRNTVVIRIEQWCLVA